MPDIGLLELILIGIVAFLVLGPERMPELFSQVGSMLRSGRKWVADIKQEIERETQALKQPVEDVKDALSGGLSSVADDLTKPEKSKSKSNQK